MNGERGNTDQNWHEPDKMAGLIGALVVSVTGFPQAGTPSARGIGLPSFSTGKTKLRKILSQQEARAQELESICRVSAIAVLGNDEEQNS